MKKKNKENTFFVTEIRNKKEIKFIIINSERNYKEMKKAILGLLIRGK